MDQTFERAMRAESYAARIVLGDSKSDCCVLPNSSEKGEYLDAATPQGNLAVPLGSELVAVVQ